MILRLGKITQWVNLQNFMVIQYRNLKKIRFPVYELSSGNWEKLDGLLFLDGKIVDDKNMTGDTLGIRRIQTPHTNLFKLKNQIDTVRGILKSNNKYFIDSYGMPFIYEKTEFCKLKYYRIKDIKPKDTCSLLKLDGVKNLFVYQGLLLQIPSTQEFYIMELGRGFYMIIQKLNLKIQEGRYET